MQKQKQTCNHIGFAFSGVENFVGVGVGVEVRAGVGVGVGVEVGVGVGAGVGVESWIEKK